VHLLADRAEQIEVAQLDTQGGEAGVRRAVLNNRGTVCDGTLSPGSRSYPGR
jgi:hypothetical protein